MCSIRGIIRCLICELILRTINRKQRLQRSITLTSLWYRLSTLIKTCQRSSTTGKHGCRSFGCRLTLIFWKTPDIRSSQTIGSVAVSRTEVVTLFFSSINIHNGSICKIHNSRKLVVSKSRSSMNPIVYAKPRISPIISFKLSAFVSKKLIICNRIEIWLCKWAAHTKVMFVIAFADAFITASCWIFTIRKWIIVPSVSGFLLIQLLSSPNRIIDVYRSAICTLSGILIIASITFETTFDSSLKHYYNHY